VYTIDGFVSRNKDDLSLDISELIEETTTWEQLKSLALQDKQRKADASAAASAGKKKKGGGGGGNKKKTVARTFGESLAALNDKLRATEHHYIRCLKPNQTLKAADWDEGFMYSQLAYSGTLEVTQIRKAGLNVRRPLKHFFQYYKVCAEDPQALRECATLRERAEMLLMQARADTGMYRANARARSPSICRAQTALRRCV
jgi:myosin heavy subunit